MKKYDGKTLLFLGTSVASVSMVKYARQEGAYVIVTDNLSPEISKAKQFANEIAEVSTRDIDALCAFATEKKVDGVLCGVSEGNLIAVQAVCERLHLPCYFTKEQWDICQDKKSFKELCIKHGVPVPREYKIVSESDIDNVSFPVIVKPTDGFAAVGITTCYDKEHLLKAIDVAKEASKTGQYIVEDFVTGTEITAVYTIKDKQISLSILRDRYPSLDHEDVTAQFDASIAPSEFYPEYMRTVDPAIKSMLSAIGAYAGTVFFQGFATDRGIFIFECGYRMNALCDYNNLSQANGINYMNMMVNYALTGEMGGADLSCDDPDPDCFCCIFNMTAHGGVIAKLEGVEACLELPGVIYAEYLLPLGHNVIENNSMAQSVFRAYINAPDLASLKNTITQMQKLVRVEDENGKDMLFLPFDVERIADTVKK
ncbi:MAG: ATP-grasp domain-containing protein [Oscillospiraceae bacterium]|nr:ATP-grasp domain-containing protein [Oscillospiraceae bacterium]